MHTIDLKTTIKVYDSRNELPSELGNLIEQAYQAARQAYCPYSHFQVGVALELVDGTIIKGNNQENAAYTSGLCAERTAAFYAAANYPDTPMHRMSIVAINPGKPLTVPISPCGSCRQSLLEFEQKFNHNIELILAAENGPIYVVPSVHDLLPCSFTSEYL